MSRDLGASANTSETTKTVVWPIVFVDLKFDSGTERYHDDVGSYTFGGQTYQGLNGFGWVESIGETEGVGPREIVLNLSALESSLVAEALTTQTVLRDVVLYLGFRGDDGALVADPKQIWSGQFDKIEVSLGRDNLIRVQCESELIGFQKANGKVYNDATHQQDHSGDLFFQYLPQMVDARLNWAGGKTRQFDTGVGGVGNFPIPNIPDLGLNF